MNKDRRKSPGVAENRNRTVEKAIKDIETDVDVEQLMTLMNMSSNLKKNKSRSISKSTDSKKHSAAGMWASKYHVGSKKTIVDPPQEQPLEPIVIPEPVVSKDRFQNFYERLEKSSPRIKSSKEISVNSKTTPNPKTTKNKTLTLGNQVAPKTLEPSKKTSMAKLTSLKAVPVERNKIQIVYDMKDLMEVGKKPSAKLVKIIPEVSSSKAIATRSLSSVPCGFLSKTDSPQTTTSSMKKLYPPQKEKKKEKEKAGLKRTDCIFPKERIGRVLTSRSERALSVRGTSASSSKSNLRTSKERILKSIQDQQMLNGKVTKAKVDFREILKPFKECHI